MIDNHPEIKQKPWWKLALNLLAGSAVSEIRAKFTHYRLTEENEIRFFG